MPSRKLVDALEHSVAGHHTIKKRAPVFPGAAMDKKIVEVLGRSEVPLSAYEVADHLRERGHHIAMMSIYRSLDRLCGRQRAEKVETLSAFRLKDASKAVLMICISCGRTSALPAPAQLDTIERAVKRTGFEGARLAVEIIGYCAECRIGRES